MVIDADRVHDVLRRRGQPLPPRDRWSRARPLAMIVVGLRGYQLDRIRAWLDPWSDPLGDGLPHGPGPARARRRRAVRHGPRGRARSSVPNAFNDFIFAEVGQEFGLLGGGRRDRAVPAARVLWHPGRAARRPTRSARCSRPASRPGCASRRSSTSGSSSRCCRSRASRCRSSAPAARRSSSASRRSGSCCRSRARPSRRGHGTTMRLLIAGGGTGGHIYPALAVARSLRARPDAPELRWLGGHRGLEATLVPAAGIPLRRLAAALAADGRGATSTPSSTRSGSASRSRRRPRSSPRERPDGDLHDRRLRRDPGPAGRGRRSRIPVVLWEGNVIPGRAVRATARLADVARGLVRGHLRGARRRRAGRARAS